MAYRPPPPGPSHWAAISPSTAWASAPCALPARASGVRPRIRAEAIRVLQRAVELGVNFFDTAYSYGPHVSEQIIADALYPYPGLVIATKGGLERPGPDQWVENGRPEFLRQQSGGQPQAAPGRADRSMAAAPDRSQGAGAGAVRGGARVPARGIDPPRRALRGDRGRTSSAPARCCRSSRCRTSTT